MQSQQDQSASPSSCPHLPPSSSSSTLSSSFSSSSYRNQAPPSASSLPPAGKEAQRNGVHIGPMNDSLYNKSSMPTTPMSPQEEEPPERYGRRIGRQTSWNDSDKRPSSYYDGLKSTDSDRRDERMASLDALRKRREIPVSVRVRSSSVGRDRASILSDAIDPKRNDETLATRGTRNILDLRTRSSSLTRDTSLEVAAERSGKGIGSTNENLYNSSEMSILDKLLNKRERRESSSATKEGRRKLSRGETNSGLGETGRDNQSHSIRPYSLPLSSNLVQSWNGVGESKDDGGQPEASAKKKGRRISRFLRPDFFDTPREESVFAKKKDAEAADALAKENERKQREQHLMGGFLHSLEKRLDKLRGGERSKKTSLPEAEAVVTCEDPGSIAPGCLTSTKLSAEVRKAKSIGTNEIPNPDGSKKSFASSRVDRAINSLLQRERGKNKKEVSESGLIKRAVGINERGCPSKSRSSGELACLSVSGGALLGKPVVVQKNPSPGGGNAEVNGVGTENGVGGKFSSKVNSMLAMFRRNEVERVPLNRTSRLRRTQSVAYDKSVPDDILSAIDAMKNGERISNAKSETEPKSSQTESTGKAVVKTDKVKKSSKTSKEKSLTKSKSSPLKEKKATALKTEKTSEDDPKESANEKLTQIPVSKKVADCKKEKSTASSVEQNGDTNNVKLTKSLKNEIIGTALKNEIIGTALKNDSNSTTALATNSSALVNAPQNSNERNAKSKEESKSSVDSCPIKSQINSHNESRKEIKELENIESLHSTIGKKLDRTATQDSLDSSWSACSDVLADEGGEIRERGKVSRHEGMGLGLTDFADPDALHSNCLDSPSLNDSGERVSGKGELGVDDDSEESIGDRIRRKSFYCRFNEVPSRRKSRVGRKSSASSLLYSASDHSWSPLDLKPDLKTNRRLSGSGRSSSSVSPASAMEGNSLDSSLLPLSYRTNTESKKAELSSSLSRDSFSPPPLPYSRSSAIYRRSSTSPYQDRLPSAEPLHSIPLTTGLWPTSSATSLARSNSSSRASEVEDEVRATGSRRGEESGHAQYIPSPLSPSSSMCNSYHNGISPSLFDEVSLEQDKKSCRSRKFGVSSLADGITKPSPTHRKYNRYSSYYSSDGLTSSSGTKESGPSLLTSEQTSQHINPLGLPPLGISLSKNRTFRNSTGHE